MSRHAYGPSGRDTDGSGTAIIVLDVIRENAVKISGDIKRIYPQGGTIAWIRKGTN
jgi:hypothetical protein